MLKLFVQHTFNRFGIEVQRKRRPEPAFQPYVEDVSLAGVSFQFWVGDSTGKTWYNPDDHKNFAEHTETARLAHPGNRVLEIGSHHGFYTMVLSRLVGPQGFVLAVEPSPYNSMMASAQVGLNGAFNCRVLQAAASDQRGRIKISLESNAEVTTSQNGIDVPAVTADDLDSQYGPFDILKVDVEGFERQVLAGASRLLQRRPKIFLELHSHCLSQFGSAIEDVLALLDPLYAGTFVPRNARDRIFAFPGESLPRDMIVNLFLSCES